MDGVEDEPAAGSQVVNAPLHLVAHFLRGAVRQHALGVHAAAVEGEVLAESLLQLPRVHARGADLHRVQDVNARLDQVGEQLGDGAAGMVEDLHRHLGVLLDEG